MATHIPVSRPSYPISFCQSVASSTLPPPIATVQNPTSNVSSKGKWLRTGSAQNIYSPKQHTFRNPTFRRQMSNREARKSLPFLASSSLPDGESGNEPTTMADGLLSSPAPPVETRRWSSVFGGVRISDTCDNSQATTAPIQRLSLVTRQEVDDVVSNIRTYLSARRHSDCTFLADGKLGNGKRQSPFEHGPLCDAGNDNDASSIAPDQYLVSTSDIAGILDIAIAGLRNPQSHVGRLHGRPVVLSSDSESKPTLASEHIVPGRPSLADPAVTVLSARPCFTDSPYSPLAESSNNMPKQTYVSRHRATEVD
ncbi:hypothetical protein GGR57DRAFT_270226 [Xylariaceae sp. FL1272]|nr:hypothetical protein GGR57DRAFT_270226 [Xylariaceae sp. FL1272]